MLAYHKLRSYIRVIIVQRDGISCVTLPPMNPIYIFFFFLSASIPCLIHARYLMLFAKILKSTMKSTYFKQRNLLLMKRSLFSSVSTELHRCPYPRSQFGFLLKLLSDLQGTV